MVVLQESEGYIPITLSQHCNTTSKQSSLLTRSSIAFSFQNKTLPVAVMPFSHAITLFVAICVALVTPTEALLLRGSATSTVSTSTTIPGIVNGWNISVGTEEDRAKAASFFNVTVQGDDSAWTSNVMMPFVGSTMRLTGIDIQERNAYNTAIEGLVKAGGVTWTMNVGPGGAFESMDEHVKGSYTAHSSNAGYVSDSSWIENDFKIVFGMEMKADWGLIEVAETTDTTVVMNYWSYLKKKMTMTFETMS